MENFAHGKKMPNVPKQSLKSSVNEMTTEQPVRLCLLRHGPTVAPTGCLVGSTDVPLAGHGLERLHGVASRLQAIDRWYCSPMLRTRQTLEHLRQVGVAVGTPIYDERLREIDFGAWELRAFAEIAASDPTQVEAWQHYEDFVFPGGEAVSDFVSRTKAMLSVLAASGGGSLGVVAHGGIIRTMICLALGLPARNYLLFDVQPASLAILELFSSGGVLRGLNL